MAMFTENTIALISLGFTIITTICALYLSYVALKHSTVPRLDIVLLNFQTLYCDKYYVLKFKVLNKGYWYAKPMILGLKVYCNFDKNFRLNKIQYGSVQELEDSKIREGVGNMNYLIARGLEIGKGEEGEEFHINIQAPSKPGNYKVRLDAHSKNGASYRKDLTLNCKFMQDT